MRDRDKNFKVLILIFNLEVICSFFIKKTQPQAVVENKSDRKNIIQWIPQQVNSHIPQKLGHFLIIEFGSLDFFNVFFRIKRIEWIQFRFLIDSHDADFFPFALRVRDYRRLVEQPNTEARRSSIYCRVLVIRSRWPVDLNFSHEFVFEFSLFSRFEWSKKQRLPPDQHLCVHETPYSIQVMLRNMKLQKMAELWWVRPSE